jgi:hypothetical protein
MEEYFYGFKRIKVDAGGGSGPLAGGDRAMSLFFLVRYYLAMLVRC